MGMAVRTGSLIFTDFPFRPPDFLVPEDVQASCVSSTISLDLNNMVRGDGANEPDHTGHSDIGSINFLRRIHEGDSLFNLLKKNLTIK